jgi:hypothetical protein
MALINTTTTGILGTTVYGDGQGALTVQKDGVTQGIYGNIPTLHVYKTSGNQSISSATHTVVSMTGIKYDTCNGWDSTNYRWTPNVAGYYWVNAGADFSVGSGNITVASIDLRKNGTRFTTVNSIWFGTSPMTEIQPTGSGIIYMNGTSDYLNFTAYISGTSPVVLPGSDGNWTYLQAFLFKAA